MIVESIVNTEEDRVANAWFALLNAQSEASSLRRAADFSRSIGAELPSEAKKGLENALCAFVSARLGIPVEDVKDLSWPLRKNEDGSWKRYKPYYIDRRLLDEI